MMSEEADVLFQEQKQWADRGLQTLRSFLPFMAPVGTFPNWSREERRAIGYLASATARSSESALLLCAYGQLWDAEMQVRSVLEGTLKFAYLLQSPETFAERYSEYAEDLFSIGVLKDHQKAADLLSAIKEPSDPRWQPIRDRLLSDAERHELSERFSRTVRKGLETRWGFTGLVSELSRSGDPLFRDFPAIAHAYSMASHIQHVDMIGASIAMERDLRSGDRRDSIHLAHLGRLVGDVLNFMFVRLVVGYRFVETDLSPLGAIKDTLDEANRQLSKLHSKWMSVEYPDGETVSD